MKENETVERLAEHYRAICAPAEKLPTPKPPDNALLPLTLFAAAAVTLIWAIGIGALIFHTPPPRSDRFFEAQMENRRQMEEQLFRLKKQIRLIEERNKFTAEQLELLIRLADERREKARLRPMNKGE